MLPFSCYQERTNEKTINRAFHCIIGECGEKGNPCWYYLASCGCRVIARKSLRPQVNWLWWFLSTWTSFSYWLTLSVACCSLVPLSWRSRNQSLSNICPTMWHLPHLFYATEPRSNFRIILSHSSPWPPAVPRNAYVRWHLLAFPTRIGIIRQCRLDKLVYSWTYIITALSHFTNIIYASNK